MGKFYYFGCINESGHYLWFSPHDRRYSNEMEKTPWGYHLDGKLCPHGDPWARNGQPQGRAALHHKDGWTALAFWDRSVDKRPGSNSVFLADSELSFDQMLHHARDRFPRVMDRLQFEIVEAAEPA